MVVAIRIVSSVRLNSPIIQRGALWGSSLPLDVNTDRAEHVDCADPKVMLETG